MRDPTFKIVAHIFFSLLGTTVFIISSQAQKDRSNSPPVIPKTWDEERLATLEVPLPNPEFSPKAVPSEYYYRIPVRRIYKGYPLYIPGKEPPGYLDWLKRQEPEIIWEDKGKKPRLETQSDWVKAGEVVFDAAIFYDAVASVDDVRNPEWHNKVQAPATKEGILPFATYVIREKGKVEIGNNACSFCHTRAMPAGMVVKGAQGNFPFDRAVAYSTLHRSSLEQARNDFRGLFGAPWLKGEDPAGRVDAMSMEELVGRYDAIPGGVLARHRASADSPPAIPDLIGVKERRYLDKTGLVI